MISNFWEDREADLRSQGGGEKEVERGVKKIVHAISEEEVSKTLNNIKSGKSDELDLIAV